MIQLEPIKAEEIDPSWLTEYARQELAENLTPGEELFILRTEVPVMIVGMRFGSLVRPPELWLLLCQNYKPLYLRWSKGVVRELLNKYHKLQVWVRSDYSSGLRFAEAHGFREERTHVIDGVEYKNMVARKL